MTKPGPDLEEEGVSSGAGLSRKGASPDGLPPLRDVIESHELRAKKSLGQNFLLDLNITRKIARQCGDLSSKTIVEVGPGPGGLTRALLLEGAHRVIAVERDERCRPALLQISAHYPDRLDVHFGDALETNWPDLLGPSPGPVTIAANLPYGVASLLLVNWLEIEPWPPWFEMITPLAPERIARVASSGATFSPASSTANWLAPTA